jgi:hypothetical protein
VIRRRFKTVPAVDLGSLTIGNALVVHPAEGISRESQALALGVAADPDHDLVIVDLPAEAPIPVWEAVAAELPRRRRGIRLVIGGRTRETTALAGQWLAERLGRTVIAPDGLLVPSAGGALFVHSGPGTGWVRFQPGRMAVWHSKRFPSPSWDGPATGDAFPTSARGVAEPLPAGVWVRPAVAEQYLWMHRNRLIHQMPQQREVMTVVLGSPGGPTVSVDDAARLWHRLPAELRELIRFAQYGPVAAPSGTTIGQMLADLLGEPVTFYTGLPLGNERRPDVHVVSREGHPAWKPFARELTFTPVPAGEAARGPRVRSHRAPLPGLTAGSAPAVYWYAPDAVIEVVPSGLLVRPPTVGQQTDDVRAVPADPLATYVTFEDATAAMATRMRDLATDVLQRLEPAVRQAGAIVPATALVADHRPAGGVRRGPLDLPAVPRPGVAEAAVAVIDAEPVAVPESGESADGGIRSGGHAGPRGSGHAADPAPVDPGPAVSGVVSVAPTEVPAAPPTTAMPTVPPATVPTSPSTSTPPVPAPAPRPPATTLPTAPAAPPTVAMEQVPAGPAAPVTAAMAAPATPVAPAPSSPVQPEPPGQDAGRPPSPTPGPARLESLSGAATGPADQRRVVRQPTPTAEASGLLPARALVDERDWLRRSLGQEYGTRSNAVARVLSQHPGFQGALARSSEDLLTDAVAVQLYLSAAGPAVDAGLRSATVGPHVPLARCVVSGLNRLPSHRGPAALAASPSPQEWELYRRRPVHTEWAFLHAVVGSVLSREGDTDVLVWSVTARRTRLLEPDATGTADRVLFAPGCRFKVLELVEPRDGARGLVLLRELTAAEVDETGRVDAKSTSLDELAATSLRQEKQRWEADGASPRGTESPVGPLTVLPGLVEDGGRG